MQVHNINKLKIKFKRIITNEIKITKESLEQFNHDKNVAGTDERIECPINNGADLHADGLLESIFDFSEYISGPKQEALGYINGVPFMAKYQLGYNVMELHPTLSFALDDEKVAELTTEINNRANEDDEAEADVKQGLYYGWFLTWKLTFFYRPEWM